MNDSDGASLRTLLDGERTVNCGTSQINYPFRLGTCAPHRRGGQVRFLNGRWLWVYPSGLLFRRSTGQG